jgi:arylsulfatase A-like enzyme/Flp pilus assembly protein TadD
MRPIALLALLYGCDDTPSEPSQAIENTAEEDAPKPIPSGPSIVLITLDTTRVDHIGAYGHEAARTPMLDGLANEGVRFERAYSTVPLTTPAHASILSGLYPPRHGIRNNGDAILSDDITTFTEVLSESGYKTAASVSAFVTTKLWNLDQGFDDYFDEVNTSTPGNKWGQERPAGAVVDDLIGWMEEPDNVSSPFFLWAHFYDPHHPYAPPEPYATDFEDPYDGEIAYVDDQLTRLQEKVDAVSGDEGTVWIVVSDHGEAFHREHGEVTHGLFIFDPTMRVPFIVRPAKPLSEPVVVSDATVSIVDVAPTALSLLSQAVPEGLDGVDLSPMFTAEKNERRGVYMESLSAQQRFGYHPEVAVTEGPMKLIDTPSPRLFNVDADPEELTNLIGQQPEVEERLRQIALETWATTSTDGTAPAPEVIEQLAALGYVSTDFTHDESASTVDAKDKVDVITRIEDIRAKMHADRDFAAAEEQYRELMIAEPTLSEARMGLARALGGQGKDAEAEVVYKAALELQPTSSILRVNLANVMAAQGRHEDGLTEMLNVLEQIPGDSTAQIGALRMLTDLNRDDEALALAKKWLEEKAGDPGLQAHLGVLLSRNGDIETAFTLLKESLKDDVPRQLVHRTLAVIQLQRNHPRLALHNYRKELQYFPIDPSLHLNCARILMTLKEWDDAIKEFEAYNKRQPGDIMIRQPWAQAVFNTSNYAGAAEILAPVLTAQPNNPDVLLLHANILAKIGDREEAKAVAAQANELNRKRVEERRKNAPQPPSDKAPAPQAPAPPE